MMIRIMMIRIILCSLLAIAPAAPTGQASTSSADLKEPVRACNAKLPAGTPCVRVCNKTDAADAECVMPPHVIEARDPEYSEDARRAGVNGTVVLSIVVGTDGGVQYNVALQSSPGYGLEEEAIRAVRKWKFKPATMRGNPVSFRTQVEVNFRMAINPR